MLKFQYKYGKELRYQSSNEITVISLNFKGSDKQIFESKIVNIFLFISFDVCIGCYKGDSSFENLQHMFLAEKKEELIFNYTLSGGLKFVSFVWLITHCLFSGAGISWRCRVTPISETLKHSGV